MFYRHKKSFYLVRLTRFSVVRLYGATDTSQPVDDPQRIEQVENPPRSYVLVLRRGA